MTKLKEYQGIGFEPRIVGFVCNWDAYSGVEMAGADRKEYPASIKLVKLMCLGRLHLGLILKAFELGADVIKLNMAKSDRETLSKCPEPYRNLDITDEEAMKNIVRSAGKSLVIISGGGMIQDHQLLNKTRICLTAGASGIIFGRNIWLRKFDDALTISNQLFKILQEF